MVPQADDITQSFSFRAGRVFGADCSTESIYQELVQPLLPLVWAGGVGTLFAYGQTGSGKTYTVSGLERRIAETLGDGTLEGPQRLHVTIFELAGNSAYDLLNSRAPFSILEDSFGDSRLHGAQEHQAGSSADLLGLIERAASFRQTAQTEKNDGSSRSHAICRIRVENPSPNARGDGLLYLVDLAGSEAARDIFNHSAERMKETREINMSLSVLKDCIRGIATADASPGPGRNTKKPYIPFRQSMLTKVLKHVFDPSSGRECKTAVLACINPSFLDTGATKNTLRYAEMLRSAEATNKPAGYNPAHPATWGNKELKTYIMAKSGTPSISPSVLAPRESGAQLLQLPAEQFIARCLETEGVTEAQAKAFHAKFWRLHIDSRRGAAADLKGDNGSAQKCRDCSDDVRSAKFLTSRDPALQEHAPPFKERIRPGMVVSWTPSSAFPMRSPTQNLAVVLCPQNALGDHVRDALGVHVAQDPLQQSIGVAAQRYLCAIVVPGAMTDSFEVSLWRQMMVDLEQMEREVLLEYDPATRYYHATV
ncbi:uncharacterized protein N7482_005006 [Penicillium canariense]|uniref:Kinesin motor domain-containing protein n=1 Tax=Penicillium canariense TaxID=189055 RepID=A0A9W9LMR6_9EURO|nr:uncharacterized protein N7482_005006 [Penicillium canariense]KAJ5166225.1 hypothetical protein N7482_005006 [Penicillium canariense]